MVASPGYSQAEIIIASMSTGLDANGLQQLSNLYNKGDLTPTEYGQLLGTILKGDSKYKDAFNTLIAGLTNKDTVVRGNNTASAMTKYRALVGTALDTIKATGTVSGEVTDVANTMLELSDSKITRDLLAGSVDPEGLLKEAARAASKLTSDPTANKIAAAIPGGIDVVKKLYAGNYLEAGRTLDTMILSNLDPNSKAASYIELAINAKNTTITTVQDIDKLVKSIESGKADAAGTVVAVVQIAQRIINQVCELAISFGGDKATAREAMTWTNIATGCVTSIATGATAGAGAASYVGIAVGALSCALSIVAEATKTVPTDAEILSKDPLAYFKPSKMQLQFISADADRLAMVLRYHYNITTYMSLAKRVATFEKWMDPLQNYPRAADTEKPIPAYTMLHVLHALCTRTPTMSVDKPIIQRLDNRCAYGNHHEGKNPSDHDNPDEFMRGGDIPADAIMCYATYLRSKLKEKAVAAGKSTAIISRALELYNFDEFGSTMSKYYDSNSEDTELQSAAPVIFADELLQFFMALTIMERTQGVEALDAFNPGKTPLPVRLHLVGTGHRNYILDENNADNVDMQKDIYSDTCWTNLERGSYDSNHCKDISVDLAKASPSLDAIREVAFIRLLSAFSYMHLSAVRNNAGIDATSDALLMANVDKGTVTTGYNFDPIGSLPFSATDPLAPYTTPVNPRMRIVSGALYAPTWQTMWKEMAGRAVAYKAIKDLVLRDIRAQRAANKTVQLASIYNIDRTTITGMQNYTTNKEILKRIVENATTLNAYTATCKADTITINNKVYYGQPGAIVDANMKLIKFTCCPSLYYDQNKALCTSLAIGARCQPECIDLSSYLGSAGITDTSKLRLISWEEYQKYILQGKYETGGTKKVVVGGLLLAGVLVSGILLARL